MNALATEILNAFKADISVQELRVKLSEIRIKTNDNSMFKQAVIDFLKEHGSEYMAKYIDLVNLCFEGSGIRKFSVDDCIKWNRSEMYRINC